MIEGKDYIATSFATVIGERSALDTHNGIFVGTHRYFFYIPQKVIEYDIGISGDKSTTKEFFYEQQPLVDHVIHLLKHATLSPAEFENFVSGQLCEAIREVRSVKIEDIAQFKIEAKWLSSAVIINKRSGKTGWKPFALNFKKDKKQVQKFYQNHPKLKS